MESRLPIHFFLLRHCGPAELSALLHALFLPLRGRGLPDVPGGADLPPVPDQRLLRFPERHYSSPYQQGPAASLLRVYHSGADDRLQFMYVLSGA